MNKVTFHWGLPFGAFLGNLLIMGFGGAPTWGFAAGILFATWVIWYIEKDNKKPLDHEG